MTQARRVEKLEAQVASLRRRLDARTGQLILLLGQIEQMKQALDAAGLEFEFQAVDLGEADPP